MVVNIIINYRYARKKGGPFSFWLSLCPSQHWSLTNDKTVLSSKHDLQYLIHWLFLLSKQYLNGFDL